MSDLEHRVDETKQQYLAQRGGDTVGHIEYRDSANARLLTHTEVNPELEGHGVGSALVRFALEDIKDRRLYLVPMCPFVAAYVQRHRDEYAVLVNPAHRAMYGL
jgi:predicted GNAT family acetyltransferase